jgi:hypothetical protein
MATKTGLDANWQTHRLVFVKGAHHVLSMQDGRLVITPADTETMMATPTIEPFSWRNLWPVHRCADVFPMLDDPWTASNGRGDCSRSAATVWSVPNGIRTRVLALKGPRPGPLDDGDRWSR